MWTKELFFVNILVLGSFVYAVPPNLCPNPEDILPCACNFPSYYLVCKDIYEVEELRRVAANLEGSHTEFDQLLLVNSSLQYLPRDLLQTIKVYELSILNVTLVNVFKEPPASLDQFQVIRFNNVRLLRYLGVLVREILVTTDRGQDGYYIWGFNRDAKGILWKVFKNMKNLRTITIFDIPVPVLGEDFSHNMPRNIRDLEFRYTRTKKFELGVFNEFKNLEKIDVYHGKLEELHRGNFPVPFNVQTMYFSHNKIKTIPGDLFTQMPKLKFISLVGNQISTVPESAFGGHYGQLQMFLLKDNPLKCDCSLKWIVYWKPTYFDGTCSSPKVMHGKELKQLNGHDFHC